MVKVDLITGFLGAGKTTFIQKYIKYLKANGERIHIIENEYAETGCDSLFLQNETNDCCKISDLSGMCMCCIGKKEFIRLLLDSAQAGCDRIVVEPSGIYDVDEFFDVLSDSRVSALCEIGCILSIVDPFMQDQLTEEAKYLTFSQLIASGSVIFSKTQLMREDELQNSINFITQLLAEKGCENGLLGEVISKNWDDFTDSDFKDMEDSAYYRLVHDRELFDHSEFFRSRNIILKDCLDEEDIHRKVQSIFEGNEYGVVYRVKGFVQTVNHTIYEVNCTGQLFSIEKINSADCPKTTGSELVIIYCKKNRSSISSIFAQKHLP